MRPSAPRWLPWNAGAVSLLTVLPGSVINAPSARPGPERPERAIPHRGIASKSESQLLATTTGGLQLPSPGGRIDGASAFGQ